MLHGFASALMMTQDIDAVDSALIFMYNIDIERIISSCDFIFMCNNVYKE